MCRSVLPGVRTGSAFEEGVLHSWVGGWGGCPAIGAGVEGAGSSVQSCLKPPGLWRGAHASAETRRPQCLDAQRTADVQHLNAVALCCGFPRHFWWMAPSKFRGLGTGA